MSGVEPAPLRASDLDAVLRPFGQSVMLPAEAYTEQAVFEWEQRHFFRGWICIGRSADIAEPGMQRAEQAGDTSVLLVRDEAGVLRAFANVCRHRAHELLPCGSTTVGRAITCPYHAWSYRLDGRLFSAAGYRRMQSFSMDDFPLVSIEVEEWHGWVFVDLSGTAGPLAAHLSGLSERVAPYRPEHLVVAGRHEYVIEANWKIIHENYQECYHCPSIHPELCEVSNPDSGDNYVAHSGAWVGGYLDLREHAATMSMDGSSGGATITGLAGAQLRTIDYVGVFPNLLISMHPDYVMAHRAVPLSPNRTWVECTWAFPREAVEAPGFDPAYAIDFWDVTNRQDWNACESVQRGLESGRAVPGPLSPDEDAVYHFITMVARGYRGEPLGDHVVRPHAEVPSD